MAFVAASRAGHVVIYTYADFFVSIYFNVTHV